MIYWRWWFTDIIFSEVATTTFLFGVTYLVNVDAFCRKICSTFCVVAVIAHAFGVMLRILVLAIGD